MTAESTTFRGYHAIGAVAKTLKTLAEGLAHRRLPATYITLRAKDYDLITRWPQAAALHEIFVNEGTLHWHGFTLRREHGRPLPIR
jgi:hypothetical protein